MPGFLQGVTFGAMRGANKMLAEDRASKRDIAGEQRAQKDHLARIEATGEQNRQTQGAKLDRKALEDAAKELNNMEGYDTSPELRDNKIILPGSKHVAGQSEDERTINFLTVAERQIAEMRPELENNPAKLRALAKIYTNFGVGYSQQKYNQSGEATEIRMIPRTNSNIYWLYGMDDRDQIKNGRRNPYMEKFRKFVEPAKDGLVTIEEGPGGWYRKYEEDSPQKPSDEPAIVVPQAYLERQGKEKTPDEELSILAPAHKMRIDPSEENMQGFVQSMQDWKDRTGGRASPSMVMGWIAAGAPGNTFIASGTAPSTITKPTRTQALDAKAVQASGANMNTAKRLVNLSNKLLTNMDRLEELGAGTTGSVKALHQAVVSVIGDLAQYADDSGRAYFKNLKAELDGYSSLSEDEHRQKLIAFAYGEQNALETIMATAVAKWMEKDDAGGTPRLTDSDFKRGELTALGKKVLGMFQSPEGRKGAINLLKTMAKKDAVDFEIKFRYGSDGRHTQVRKGYDAYRAYVDQHKAKKAKEAITGGI